jgi:hypothetical protein
MKWIDLTFVLNYLLCLFIFICRSVYNAVNTSDYTAPRFGVNNRHIRADSEPGNR